MSCDCGPTGNSNVCWRTAWPTRKQGDFPHHFGFFERCNDYVSKIGSKIVLIDGSRLAELMIEIDVAAATDATYTVKRIDNDFFESI